MSAAARPSAQRDAAVPITQHLRCRSARNHLDLEVEPGEPVHTDSSPVGIGGLIENRGLDVHDINKLVVRICVEGTHIDDVIDGAARSLQDGLQIFKGKRDLAAEGQIKPVDIEALARLLNGAALNAALWVAASDDAYATLPKAVAALECLASGIMNNRPDSMRNSL